MLYTRHNIKKVIVGMSGGVDSSVSAWLLQQQGYQVEGLFMKNWENDDHTKLCSSEQDLSDAHSICNNLKIHLHMINFSKEYWDSVFQRTLSEYKRGYTPNPDVLCNKKIKFKHFLEFSLEDLKADFIATGHYVRRVNINKKIYLMKGIDYNKDQSYFLHTLDHRQLKKCLFPVGTFIKTQIRNIAKKLNFITARKKDSTGICFIGKCKFRDFLSNYIPKKKGFIINTDGKKIGIHQGIAFYTLGQRTGLNIGGKKEGNGKPWYVIDKNTKKNILIVAQGKNNPYLMSSKFTTSKIHWITTKPNQLPIKCTVKTRYRQSEIQCNIYPISSNKFEIFLKHPISAITPGQSAVFYLKEHCLGGGIILDQCPKLKFCQNN